MSRQIICTIGTSLLTNRDNRPWAGWSPRNNAPLPDADQVEAWLKTADPEKASAETNTLRALGMSGSDDLALLHSDTPEGRFCAERLGVLYKTSERMLTFHQIGELGYGAAAFTRGLKSLVDESLKLIRDGRERGRVPVLCATGGFKAEIAFLNLLGALLEIEVVYIHELHRELVRLPRLPLAWDVDFVKRHRDFFVWIDAEPRRGPEVESWLGGRPELRPLIEEDDDGHTYLTAAGDLLFKAAQERSAMGPRSEWPATDPRPPADKNQLSTVAHHRPPGWERVVERLCRIDCVRSVRYDASAIGPKISVLDGARGIIGVCLGDSDKRLPLRVETTARGEPQTAIVADYLRNHLK